MAKQRIPETDKGIQGEFNANAYDQMMRRSRDRGELQIQHILQKGITQGVALEIGPGPGYIGLDLISDLRRDICLLIKWFLWFNMQPKEIRPGLTASINAAYLEHEILAILKQTRLCDSTIEKNPFGMTIFGSKHQ